MYGAPSYSSNPFPPPPVNYNYGTQYHHYAPHPPAPVPQAQPPVYLVDPNTFRRDYMQSLEELTFNSRPVIQHLSSLAQEYSRYADIVVSCVETHIRRVHPSIKLPAFYLLDAISKNYYEPYARRFSPVVTRLFLDTYGQVDKQTQLKMEEMLLTWRTGSPTRGEVFGAVNQIAIERGVWGDGGTLSITKGQVLSELQFAIDAKQRDLQVNQYDMDAQRKIEVLYALRKCIMEVGVTQDELRQILNQLRDLVKSSTSTAPPAQAPRPPSNAWNNAPAYPSRPVPSQPPVPSFPTDPAPFSHGYSQPAPAPAPPQPQVPATIDTAKLNSIISSLVNAGVVAPPATATPPPPPPAPIAASSTKAAPQNSDSFAKEASWRDYRKAILSQPSALSSAGILRTKPSIKTFLYTRLPSQCKQCGLRFPDSVYGRKQHQQHLDTHFKDNRMKAQAAGRGHSRNSFLAADNWIRNEEVFEGDKGKVRADITTKDGPPVQSEAELRRQFVVVPAGDEAKFLSCPICKENIKTEFLEDDEEWVWRNAILKDNKVYHATCHAEALTSTNTLAARLRSDMIPSSRDGTPEVNSSSRSTPPLGMRMSPSPPTPDSKSGMKRKVDDNELTDNLPTPPSKKVALS
ncbi:hypothetical protein DFP72DRAFT_878535 [Ephemerocybe angulata]|uniref:CID domain-containing protein n=1 Tax=Ephemerocybe angulata TaxID=980116 RepID=A0A8H6MEP1_9AGAR|nr:hypothetical protein DFP72DRAFT_878535 [Tulosesus angulatus]